MRWEILRTCIKCCYKHNDCYIADFEDSNQAKNDTENEYEECCICFEKMTTQTIEFECKHKFHEKCILEWFTKSSTCPICLTVIIK